MRISKKNRTLLLEARGMFLHRPFATGAHNLILAHSPEFTRAIEYDDEGNEVVETVIRDKGARVTISLLTPISTEAVSRALESL